MCTVTYIKTKEGFILTSNRDETASRPTLPPQQYLHQGKKIFFPKDELAQGSWIAFAENGQVACLLNGAFQKHKRQLPYDRSRGLILLDSFNASSPESYVNQVELNNVEPFTLILVNVGFLVELKWDGNQKHIKQLNDQKNHIWSSATLYPADVALKKENWFKKWMETNSKETDKNIYNFHATTHGNKPSEDVRSKFKGDLQTVSITQINAVEKQTSMSHHNLMNHTVSEISSLKPSASEQG